MSNYFFIGSKFLSLLMRVITIISYHYFFLSKIDAQPRLGHTFSRRPLFHLASAMDHDGSGEEAPMCYP